MFSPLSTTQLRSLAQLLNDEQCRDALAIFPDKDLTFLKRQDPSYLEGYISCLYDVMVLIGSSLAQEKKVSTFEFLVTIIKTTSFVISDILLGKKVEAQKRN